VAAGISQLGDVIFFVSLAYASAHLGSPALAGVVMACAATPRAVLMLVGGAVTDRFDARRLMLASDIACALVLLGALAAIDAWGLSAPVLIAIGACFGTADAFYGPASATFPRQLVAASDLPRLAGIRQLINRFTAVGGGPLGLALVAFGGLQAALAADAASYAVIAVTLLAVRPRWARARATGRSIAADIRAGLAYLRSTPPVRDLVIALSGLNVFGSPVLSIGIALRTTEQGWGANRLGVLTGCIGVGAVVGTLVSISRRPARPVRFALQLMFVQAAAVAAVGRERAGDGRRGVPRSYQFRPVHRGHRSDAGGPGRFRSPRRSGRPRRRLPALRRSVLRSDGLRHHPAAQVATR
jgi:MFS family permease